MKAVDFQPLQTKLRQFLSVRRANPKIVMVRNAESQGNLAGTITGWMDVGLTDFGRKHAFLLNQVYEEHEDDFNQVHSSDLKRSIDTSFYALAFPSNESLILQSPSLHSWNFAGEGSQWPHTCRSSWRGCGPSSGNSNDESRV